MLKSFLGAFSHTQSTPVELIKKMSNKFFPRSTNHNNFWAIFASIALKLEKVEPTFSNFNPCLSLPSLATDDRKQFQSLKI